jgi:hypothetical protein
MKVLLPLVAIVATLAPPLLGEEEVDIRALVREFRAAMKSRDAEARIRAVREVEATHHDDVAAALVKHLDDRDPKVRAAVARAVGRQGRPEHVKSLLKRVRKWERDDPQAVIGCLEGLALLPDRSAIGILAEVVRKILSGPRLADRPVGIAAVAALAKIREKKAVDELTKLLDLTRPLGPAQGYVSDEVRVFRTGFRQAIFEGLASLTDQHFRVTDVWQSWWRKEGKGFRFPTEPADPNAASTYEDPGYGFHIEKPGPSWTFTRNESEHVIIKLVHPAGPRSAATDAELFLEAHATTEYSIRTPSQAAAYLDEWAATVGFRKDSGGRPMVREGPATTDAEIAGQWGKLWRATGMTDSGKDVTLRKYFFLRGTLLYTVTVETLTGLPEAVSRELDEALHSLRFTE